jgi:hypothetical protein
MLRTAPLVLVAAAGCPKPQPPPAFDWAERPRVPAPASGTYGRAPGLPADPGIAQLVQGHAYDAALAGAAAGVALALAHDEGGLTAPELREAAWRAGWPYPITSAQLWVGTAGAPPPPPVGAWIASQADVVGLVRVRAGLEEAWVGLSAKPRADLGALPRQLPVGGALALPATPGARATIVDPMGRLQERPLDAAWTTTVELGGEWLVEVRDDLGPIATFPVYVGLVPPDLDLLVPTEPPPDGAAAADAAHRTLDLVREAYGLPAYVSDPLLDAAARTWLADPTVPVSDVARITGLDAERTWRWDCRGSSVESCLDSIVWDVRARPGLLLEDALLGLAATVSGDGVHVAAAVGSAR